jgi:hypothetical protein
MAQVLRKSQAPKADRFSINQALFKNDKVIVDTSLDNRRKEQLKVLARHNAATGRAIDTAMNYCSVDVRDMMRDIKHGC